MSLRARLMVLAAVCVLPAALLLAVGQFQLRNEREAEVRQQIIGLAQSEADHIAGIIAGANQLLTALEQSPPIRERNSPLCSALLSRLTQAYPAYAGISADDTNGRSFCTSDPGRAVYDGGESYFQTALEQRRFAVGGSTISPFTNAPALPVARPVTTPDGTILGVLVLSLAVDQLAHDLAIRLPAGAALSVVDRNGAVLLQVPDSAKHDGTEPPTQIIGLVLSDPPDVSDVTGSNGLVQIVAHAPVGDGGYGLQVITAEDKDIAFAALSQATSEGIVLIIVALVLALLTAGWMARRFIQVPIRALLSAADRLREGETAVRTTVTAGKSELARLGRALNMLALALEQREEARASAEEQLRQLAATLEQRVDERTRDLAAATTQLAAEAEERQRVQASLAQVQKLDALGKLTGGVAHDFNNLLTAILGSLELATNRVTDGRIKRLLAVAIQAAQRGAKLTAQMLAFSRKQDLTLRPVNINDTIADMSDLMRRTIGPLVQIEHDLADDLCPAMADPVQLEVALLNLAVNARDAMPEGGTLHLRTGNVSVAETSGPAPALQAGDYAMLAVSDTGHGMSAEVRANAFEPFFTTKGPGKGTGLGLSMVYGFASQAGGGVTIDSCVGKGTTVSIYLPRANTLPEQEALVTAPPAISEQLRILLVDDDVDVVETTKAMLVDLGHDVVATHDCQIATDLLQEAGDFDLLLVDFAMPVMTGPELATQAREVFPDLPILFMTGYVDSLVLKSWSARGCRTLNKPFNAADLANALRETLGLSLDSKV